MKRTKVKTKKAAKEARLRKLQSLSDRADLLLGPRGFFPIGWENQDGVIVDLVEDTFGCDPERGTGKFGFEMMPREGPSVLWLTLATLAEATDPKRRPRRRRKRTS